MTSRMNPADFRRMVEYDSSAANRLVDQIDEGLTGVGVELSWESVAEALGELCSHVDTLLERERELERLLTFHGGPARAAAIAANLIVEEEHD